MSSEILFSWHAACLLAPVQTHAGHHDEEEADHPYHQEAEHDAQLVRLVPGQEDQSHHRVQDTTSNPQTFVTTSSLTSLFPRDHQLTHEASLVKVPGPGHRHHGVHAPGEVVGLEQEVTEEDGGGHQPADDGRVVELGRQPVLVLETLTQRHPRHDGQPGGPLLRMSHVMVTSHHDHTCRVKAIRPATTSAQIRLSSNSAPALENRK